MNKIYLLELRRQKKSVLEWFERVSEGFQSLGLSGFKPLLVSDK